MLLSHDKPISQYQKIWAAVFILSITVGIYFRFAVFQDVGYSLFFDRDITRAANLWKEFQFAGAELSQGGRVPGGFYYYLLWLLSQVSPDPLQLHRMMIALNICGILGLFLIGRKFLGGVLPGLAAAAFYSASFVQITQHSVLWNPGFISLFVILSYWLFLEVIVSGKDKLLPWAGLASALLLQIHLSGVLLLAFFVIAIFVLRVQVQKKYWVLFVICLIVVFSPALWFEFYHDFAHSRSIGYLREVFIALGRVDSPAIIDRIVVNIGYSAASIFNLSPRALPETLASAPTFIASMVSSGFLVLIVARYLWQTCRYRSSQYRPGENSLLINSLFVVIFGGVIIITLTSISDDLRKFNYLAPGGALLGAAALKSIFAELETKDKTRYARPVSMFLLAWCTSFLVWNTLWSVPRHGKQSPVYANLADLKSIISTLRSEFGFSDFDIATRAVALARRTDGFLETLRGKSTGISYLLATMNTERAPSRFDGCVLMLRNPSLGHASTDQEIRTVFKHIPKGILRTPILGKFEGERFTYVKYKVAGNSCPRSFTNRYILTPEEMLVRKHRGSLTENRAIHIKLKNSSHRFMFKLGGDAEGRYLLSLDPGDNGYVATLHGNQTRGYMGLLSHRMLNPQIRLVSADGNRTVDIPIFSGRLGGEENLINTPWSSAAVRVPPGEYAMRFEIAELAVFGMPLGPVTITLGKRIEIQ